MSPSPEVLAAWERIKACMGFYAPQLDEYVALVQGALQPDVEPEDQGW